MECTRCPSHITNSTEVTRLLVTSSILSLLQPEHPLNHNAFNYPRDAADRLQTSYDFIIVGAGAAGCVVANRLTQNPEFKVLLLEAGPDPPFISAIPGFAPYLLSLDHPYRWNHTAEPQSEICRGIVGGRCPLASGKMVGGSTSLNAMYYLRGTRYDYDNWAAQGNNGWSYPEIIEFFRKSEDQRSETVFQLPDSIFYHGTAGDLTVNDGDDNVPLAKELMQGARAINYFNVSDFNRNYTLGFGYHQYTVRQGVRCGAAKAFLSSLAYRKNLDIVRGATVTNVNINNVTKLAEGVTFLLNGKERIVNSSKEIVLSAGAVNTAQILMLSGVGPREHLSDLQVPVVVENEGVGENLKVHVQHFGLYYCFNKSNGEDVNVTLEEIFGEYLARGSGPLASNGYTFGGFIKTTNDTSLRNYTDIGVFYNLLAGDRNSTDEFSDYMHFTDEIRERLADLVQECDLILVMLQLLHPKSTGSVRLRTNDINSVPVIQTNSLKDQRDVDTLVDALAIMTRLGQNVPGVAEVSHLQVGQCGGVAAMTPEYWECAMPFVTRGGLHAVGTCKMGPDHDASAVVDPGLRVRGVQYLSVVDEAVMPDIVSGDVGVAAMMVGEKGASILSRRWWLDAATDRLGMRVLYPQGMIM